MKHISSFLSLTLLALLPACASIRSLWKPKEDFIKKLELPDWVLESSIKLRVFNDSFNSVNPEDALPEDDIAYYVNGARKILAAAPAAMKDIFKMAGCLDGTELVTIRGNKITENQEDIWYGICKSGNPDTIVFKVHDMGNDTLYRLYENELVPEWEEARKVSSTNPEKAMRLANKLIEHEPAHPGARRMLGSLYLKAGYCPGAVRNYRIYLRIIPRTPEKEKIDQLLKEQCKDNLIPKKKETKEYSEDVPPGI
ncbi:tetratricopeptide repeat protein [Leptospira perolatii]|nr:tetratricopeptide repeat protein [Leptospira perolatii]